MLKRYIQNLFGKLGYEIKRKKIADTLFEIDPWFNDLHNEALVKTQMESTDSLLRRQRHYVLLELLKNVDVGTGDICEIGCWRGLTAYQIGVCLRMQNKKTIFHIFDSFAGLSEIMPVDKCPNDERDEDELRKHFSCSLDTVKNNLKEFDFIKYYDGWIPDRFHEVKDATFSFVHIDVDLYQPTLDTFEFFYQRLSNGGIMVFDDYGCVNFPGAKKAIDECLERHGKIFFLHLPTGQAFLIKGFLGVKERVDNCGI